MSPLYQSAAEVKGVVPFIAMPSKRPICSCVPVRVSVMQCFQD